ncbi:maternal effect protein staufen [Bactrocera tryoni]|uniref:maternal effect protein staufen n=1 Tax=Bactrocera tryoni TaxID=59916 RepID=UPI001A956507|nr:maternal effect protein staufen [Bactrocera tryoni]XP_039953617.1 maternal effect protein staufen [Bactrocera tryoni]
MQHHAHVARTAPPHLRAHHMAVPPPHTQSQPHIPQMNLAHVPPPQPTGQQQQQTSQQKQSHLSNGPATAGTAAVISGSSIAVASHVRDHHTARLNQQPLQQQQHQHPSSMHTSTQLQKLRQQHQHINSNNNNSTNKNNYHHHQAQQQYNNSTSNTHGNVLPVQAAIQQQSKQTTQVPHHTSRHHQQQQQHQLHHQQQPQQQATQQLQHKHTVAPMPPQQSHGHVKHQQPLQQTQPQQQQAVQTTTNLVLAKNVINTHVPPPSLPQTQHQQKPPPTTLNYYTAGNTQSNNNNVHKSKYNNNNSVVSVSGGAASDVGSGVPPKTILQNPNRVLKARLHASSAANNIDVSTVRPSVGIDDTNKTAKNVGNIVSSSGNNVVSSTETHLSEVVANNVTTAAAESTTRRESLQIVQSTNQVEAASIESNKENMTSAAQTTNSSIEVSSSTTNNNNILSNEDNTVAKNSKEKTPMCLVNELARYNKITHQYRLTSEKGPAHCKRFTVTLKLGEEEYSAEGFKIKKAQHLAAAEAIEKTKYKHPVPKVIRRGADGEGSSSRANITPTVELNALAMKLGQQTYYLLDPRQVGPSDGMGPPPDAMMAPRFNVPPPPHALPPHAMAGGHMLPQHPPPHVRLMDPAYVRRNGPYATAPPQPQMHGLPAAGSVMRPRYGAPAQRAYMPKYNQQQRYPLMAPPPMAGGPHNGMLPPPPLPHPQHPHHGGMPHRYGMPAALTRVTLVVGKQKFVGLGRTLQQAKHDAAARALQVLKAQAATQLNEELNNSLEESDNKSPISLVYEIGIQRSLTVHFKVLREEGPAHMKKFVTACVVGTIVTEGEGNGKKISKKRAAEKMLEELRKLPPLTPTKSPIKRIKVKTPSKAAAGADSVSGGGGKSGGSMGERRKRGSSSIKEKNDADTETENPITRLIQLQQNRKEKEPIFELIAKNGNENSRRREFIIEVTAHGMVARGTGNSKKLAKRNAAQNLLLAMGERDTAAAELKSNTPLAYTQSVVCVESVVTAGVQASKEQTNTVLQPNVEATAAPAITATPAVAAEAHIDVPLVTTTAGQVPGILILRHNKKHATKKKESMISTTARLPVVEEIENKQEESVIPTTQTAPAAVQNNASSTDNQPTAAANAKPIVEATATPAVADSTSTASSTTGSAAPSSSSASKPKPAGVHTKDQLLYLAKLLGFEVNFSDFPKGNHSEFLTIVTLSSNPPQICHGMGTSAEESQNDAAKNALKLLSKLGLNNAAN